MGYNGRLNCRVNVMAYLCLGGEEVHGFVVLGQIGAALEGRARVGQLVQRLHATTRHGGVIRRMISRSYLGVEVHHGSCL
jgi:hypothetical protein